MTLCGNIVDIRLEVRSMSKEALMWLQTRSVCADILRDILIAYLNAILVQRNSPCYVEEETNAEMRHNCTKPA